MFIYFSIFYTVQSLLYLSDYHDDNAEQKNTKKYKKNNKQLFNLVKKAVY